MADEHKRGRAQRDDDAPAPDPERAAREAQREAAREVEDDAPRIPVERYLGPDGGTLTGFENYVLAGALAGVTKKNLTIAEAQAACEAWLAAEVKEA